MRKVFTAVISLSILSSCSVVKSPVHIPEKEVKKIKKEHIYYASLNSIPLEKVIDAYCKDKEKICIKDIKNPKQKVTFKAKTEKEFLNKLSIYGVKIFKRENGVLVFYTPEKISIKASNLPFGEFLKLVAEKLGDYSLSIGKDVDLSKPITVYANNQDIDAVLKEVAKNIGYDAEIDKDKKIIVITGFKEEIIDLPSFFSNFKTANLTASASVYGVSGGGSNTSSSMQMQIFQTMKTDFERTIRKILGEDGRYSIDYNFLKLYVEGRATRVREVKRYVEKLKKELKKQVLIDVAVIEQTITEEQETGVDLSAIIKATGSQKWNITQTTLGATTGILNIIFSSDRFNAVLKALQSKAKARVITRFRISVPNYDFSIISSSITRQFTTRITREVNPVTGREVFTPTREQVSESSSLLVRPIIRGKGKIDIVLAPTISSILGIDEEQFGDITLKSPVVAQRNAPVRLLIEEDKAYIVGGIISNSKNNTKTGVPILSSLPLLEGIFGKVSSKNKNSAIYIMLRAKILEEGE